jgi:hypothetical protein
MSLLKEIHSQSRSVRMALWLLSTFTVVSFIGFFWFNSVERSMFMALNRTDDEQAAFNERQEARSPKPLAFIGKSFGSLSASIGGMLGLDPGEGFDREPTSDKVYLLPLSK